MFSQILVGARTTLFVGIVAVGVAALIGVPLGILAAMATRWFGEVLMRGTDLLLAFPALLLAIMFSAVYGGSTLVAMIAIGIATVPAFVRLIRSGALQVMRTEYVLAARAAGRRPVRHRRAPRAAQRQQPRHRAGVGRRSPSRCWPRPRCPSSASARHRPRRPGAGCCRRARRCSSAPRAWPLFPGLAIAVAVLGFNLLGDGLRDYFDPRLEDRR